MTKLLLVFFLLGMMASLAFAVVQTGQSEKSSPPRSLFDKGGRISIISSSHQDIAWMDSPEKCMEYRDKACITPALEMMARNPQYCFVMENMLNLMEYVERHPDRKAEILRYTKEGRMEWGATLNQPYESLLSGEQLVREVYFGRRWLLENFPGCDARVYFNPDVPGRALQMQQILAKAGIPYMIISRFHEGFYRWESPDGSSVLAYSPGHYTNSSALLNAKPEEGAKLLAQKLSAWNPYYEKRNIPPEFPLIHSEDFSKPTDFGGLIRLWNESRGAAVSGTPSRVQYSSARGFFEALDQKSAAFDRIMGERPNLWLYIHGPTHHWAISAQREAGTLLPAAEMFSAAAALLQGSFKGYPAQTLKDAWMASIYPDHGWGGKEGQITDRLFRKKYEFARDTGKEVLDAALDAIGARVKTAPDKGIPVVIFNPLSWVRSDPVTIEIKRPFAPVAIQDARGKSIPSQTLPPLPGRAGDVLRLEFIAPDVPAAGYKTFYLAPGALFTDVRPQRIILKPAGGALENEFYKVELAPGGIKSIFDKEFNLEILNTQKFLGFEIFTMQSVGSGAGEFGRVQQPTMEGFDKLSSHKPSWILEPEESGPIKTVYSLIQRLASCLIKEKIILYHPLKRIDCEVSILDWDGAPYREFRLALPVASLNGNVAYEVPMGVVEAGKSEAPGTGGPAYGSLVYDQPMSDIRPREVRNFMNVSDTRFGLTMSTSVAVNDYLDPTSDPARYPILQAVLLASRRSCHGQGNWYLQEGDHHYRFSIVSHAPGWRNGYRRGIQANAPFFAVIPSAAKNSPSLPEEQSFFSVSTGNVVLSTVKKAEDDDSVVFRLYEIEGKDGETRLEVFCPIQKAEAVNIIENEGRAIQAGKNNLAFKIGHRAIETFKIRASGR
jgi:alpha-mannosidase